MSWVRARLLPWLLLPVVGSAAACDEPTEPPYVPLAERDLAVTPTSAALEGVGATFTFTLVDTAGAAVPADSVTWFSLAPTVASMDPATGRVTAVAAGQAVVAARVDPGAVAYGVVNVAVPGGPLGSWGADTLARPYLFAVWGTGDDDVFVGGRDEYVHHYDGSEWRAYRLGTTLFQVAQLGGTEGGPVFAVGYEGIQRFDGGAWQVMAADPEYTAVWAASAADAFAVAEDGWIWRYGGSGWTRTSGSVGTGAASIWGSSAGDVYVGDETGRLVHFDGTAWSTVEYGATGDIRSIWGSGPDDVYVSGSFGVVRFDGGAWAFVNTGLGSGIGRLSGRSASDVWALKRPARFARFDGTAWTRVQDPPSDATFRDVWVSPSGTVWAVGDGGELAIYADGAWTLHHVAAGPRPVSGIWSAGPGHVFTAGAGGAMRGGVDGWNPACLGDIGRPLDVWGVSPDQVFVSGYRMYITQAHIGWCESWETPSGYYAMTGVWASAPNDAWVVGAPAYYWLPAVIFHYDGDRWLETSGNLPGSPKMYDVWGAARDQVWSVGETDGRGAIWRFNGTGWYGQSVPDGPALQGVWGVSRDDVYAVGLDGRILHYDGAEWTAMASPTTADLYAVAGAAATDVFAVGDTTVLRFDGSAWSHVEGAPWAYYRSVRATVEAVYFGAEGRIITASR